MSEKKKQEIPIPFELDDFFTTQAERNEQKKEKIETIDISLIDNFEKHPFKVIENEELTILKESIKENGVLSAIIVREKANGRYELISGHRRKYACQLLEMDKIPCVIKNLSDDEATIFMVDSNLQREKILPSEKAFAYRMKLEAIRHQGKSTSRQLVGKLESADVIGNDSGDSGRTVQRYIRLTYLIPELLQIVDNYDLGEEPKIAFNPAVELSFLSKEEQKFLVEYITSNLVTPSLSQAQELKRLSQSGNLTEEKIYDLLDKEKPNQIIKFKIQEDKLFEVLPKNIAREKVENYVIKACEFYTKHLKVKEREGR